MSDLNMFRGGSTPLAGLGADCACGPFPSTYPAPSRTAVHHPGQLFKLPGALNPAENDSVRCVLCAKAGTVADQTANIIGKKIGLIRVPPRHLLTHLYLKVVAANGAGLGFDVYIDRVNQETGALVAALGGPAPLTGQVVAAADFEAFAPVESPTQGLWSATDVVEIGVIVTAGPTAGTLCGWNGKIDLLANVQGFDYGRN
jgi:hypothetical protein